MAAVEVGTGWVDVTPYHNGWDPLGKPYWHAGYGSTNALEIQASDVNNALFARCLVLREGGPSRVLVTLDIVSIPRPMDEAIRPAIRAMGIADADFVMVASHTHSGPVLDESPDPFVCYWIEGGLPLIHEYTTWLANAVVELVRRTLAAPRTLCNLDYGVGSAEFAYNRYNGYSGRPALDMSAYLDNSVPVITARAVGTGNVRAIIFGYACHAVSRGNSSSFDSDYPGEAQKILGNTDQVLTFYLPGASGDNDPAGDRGPELVRQLGRELANAVRAVVDDTNNKTRLDGTIRTGITRIKLPLARTDAMREKYEQRLAANNDFNKIGRHARRMLDPDNFAATTESVTLPIQLWTFGPDATLQLALCGSEVVSSFSHHFKTELGWGDQFWLTGHANQGSCYVVSDEMLDNGGYEPGWHPDEGNDVAWSGGSTLYEGWPCRLAGSADLPDGDGVEQRVISAIHEMAKEQGRG